MTALVVLLLLLLNVEFSFSCDAEGRVLICRNVPAHFSPGYSTLAMYVSDVGEINSTVFHSDNLTSVTRLRMDNAGVTAVAEGAFGSFLNLTSVSLTRNMLTHVTWRWFGRPDVLTELSLTENHIRALNESQLSGLVSLTELRLNKNRITTLGPNSFLSQVDLTELDLSENRMTRLSPQLLRSLRSTRVGLDRNPWDCSCGAEDFVVLLKDLQSRSQLDRHMEVTCQTPPALRGQPVWNVTVCMTSPEPGSTSESQSVHTKPTDRPTSSKPTDGPTSSKPTDGPTSSAKPLTTASQSTSETETSTDASALKTSQSATHVTSASSETEPSVTSHSGGTEKCATSESSSNTNTVCSLIFVIAFLCVPLCVLCFLTVQLRRKRSNKAVTPDRPREERSELEAERRSSHNGSAGRSENTDPEEAWRRPRTGVRAKSANAILFIAPFGVCGKNQVTAQNDSEAQSQDAKTKVENEAEATRGNQAENTSEKNEKQPDDGNEMEENSQCVSVGADALPYLSISTDQNQASPENLNQRSTDRSGQRSQMGKVMGRVSTWPPTAVQWQERCQMKEEGNETEVKKTGNKVEHPSISDKKEEEMEQNEMKDFRTQVHTDFKREDPASARRTSHKTPSQDAKSAGNPALKVSSQSEQRKESKQAAGAENRSTGSKAPPGGASPDDETLLHGNEYAFMDLLHEVAQNNGRWTRERWRQIHVNKQRR
nr:PREDICTED: cell wall protein DAN4-like isoform X1 [Paralichthys olivaceus]